MDCLRPACVCVCVYRASAIPPKLCTYTYVLHTHMHNHFSTYVCTYVPIHVHIRIGMPTRTQTHSMLECGEFIQHTAHGPDVTAQNSTRNKKLTRHHCNLKKVWCDYIRTYAHTYTCTISPYKTIYTHVCTYTQYVLTFVYIDAHMYCITYVYTHAYKLRMHNHACNIHMTVCHLLLL